MEESLAALLASCEESEFLRVTSTALKIIQNIQNEPSEERFRRIRRTAPLCEKPGSCQMLEALGFELRGNHYVLDETYVPSLAFKKKDIRAVRRRAGSILGWDVPFSMLKFTTALGSCKYGEVFGGCLEEDEIAIKTLKPDCGEKARECFDRELEFLPKLEHSNIVQLQAVTLTSDPTCIILEFIPTPLLEALNHGELGDREVVSIAAQVASAMAFLHTQDILHCDLGARNVCLTTKGIAKVCDFGLARKVGHASCTLTPEGAESLPLRWTAPEVFEQLQLTVYSDLWSFGVFLYEMATFGSVPYACFSNQTVRSKVAEGYRLLQPHNCPDELYSLMLRCWLPRATERPCFGDVIRKHLEPLKVKVHEGQLVRQSSSTSEESVEGKRSTLKSSASSVNISNGGGGGGGGGGGHKVKVKELSYPQVLVKGGGLLRVSTALVSPFHHRVVVVCGKKTTAGEVVQISLAKCGKTDLDHKSHSLALVDPLTTGAAARYLNHDERVLAVKAKAPPTAMFVLCVFTQGTAILEIVNSVKQNPSYAMTFDPRTRGYLVTVEGGTGKRGKQRVNRHRRRWCVLDGSSLLCYQEEEDEGVKQFETFVDVKSCSVSPLTGKKSSTMVRVGTQDGGQFVFSAPDKQDMLHWIEALETASHLEPSTMLLHSGDGVVVQTGYLDCQEFALESNNSSPLRSPPPLHRRLRSTPEFSGTFTAVDYGCHWTVLKSSGLVQCLVKGRPETLFSLLDAVKVKVHNPRKGQEGASYSISLFDQTSQVVLQAECPSDHFDWVLAIERVLQDKGLQDKLCGDRGNQSGYVTLKRLMMMQEGGELGQRGSAMQLYAMPRLLNTLDDVYDLPQGDENSDPQAPPTSTAATRQDHIYENQKDSTPPLSPHAYVNFIPPPPLPPRGPGAPPLPPKGMLSAGSPPEGENLDPHEDGDEEYVLMNPQSLPTTPSSATHFTSPPPLSLPATPISAHHHPGGFPSQPITIPGPRLPGKPPKQLLRSLSELSPSSPHTPSPDHSLSPSLSSSHHSVGQSLPRRTSSTSSAHSSHPHTPSSAHSSHPHTPSSTYRHTSSSSLHRKHLISGSNTNGGASSGYNSPGSSPAVSRLQSNRFPKPGDPGDDVMVGGAKNAGDSRHFISGVTSTLRQLSSDGYSSSHSSTDEIVQKLPRGWRKGYCDSKPFFVNTETGQTTWSLAEALTTSNSQDNSSEKKGHQPGSKWQVVTLEDGQVYYYHEVTRQTTWNVQDTFS